MAEFNPDDFITKELTKAQDEWHQTQEKYILDSAQSLGLTIEELDNKYYLEVIPGPLEKVGEHGYRISETGRLVPRLIPKQTPILKEIKMADKIVTPPVVTVRDLIKQLKQFPKDAQDISDADGMLVTDLEVVWYPYDEELTNKRVVIW